MNLKRGFRRIFVVLAILWLMPVIALTVVLIPTKKEAPVIHEWELDPILISRKQLTEFVAEGLITPAEETEIGDRDIDAVEKKTEYVLGTRATIRKLQKSGKLPPDPNLAYKPPSFWHSEEGTKLIQQVNVELLRKWRVENRNQQAKYIFVGFLFWAIPLVLIYLIGVLIWWIIVGFRERKL
jgi:hypothetical protein